MKIKIFYYIDSTEDDEQLDEEKKNIIESMDITDKYIEKDKFNKLFNKMKAKLKYKQNKDILASERKKNIVFCDICNTHIQKNTYDTCHLSSKMHTKNLNFKSNSD